MSRARNEFQVQRTPVRLLQLLLLEDFFRYVASLARGRNVGLPSTRKSKNVEISSGASAS